jgi:integrase
LATRPTGARSWVFIYRWEGRQRTAGLGKAVGKAGGKGVTLAEARRRAREGREMLDRKPPIDPLSMWRAAPPSSVPTFAQAAEEYIALKEPGWKSAKHAAQWRITINDYCGPLLKTPIDQIDGQMVLKALRPIWLQIPETASRLRGRIEAIIDYGKPDGDANPNPARWRGGLAKKLPSSKDLGKIDRKTGERTERGNHPALPYEEVPAFAARLRAEESVTARALESVLLTACRTNEVLGAKWSEVDLVTRQWVIPVGRLKTGKKTRKPHIVPLSDRMIEIFTEMSTIRSSGYVFPGTRDGRPLGDMTLLRLMHGRMGCPDFSVHGLRSSFRDFAGDETNAPWEVCEHALGHLVGSKVTRSYRRGDAFDKRRELMEVWSRYCSAPPPADNVIPLTRVS